MTRRKLITVFASFAAVATLGVGYMAWSQSQGFEPAFRNQTNAPATARKTDLSTSIVADGLEIPWGIAILPDGGYLVTERTGRLNLIRDGKVQRIGGVPNVLDKGQGGLLDVAVADDFAITRRIFLTYSKPGGNGRAMTAAATGVLSEEMTQISGLKDIFVQTPAASGGRHFGSRIVIDNDYAFITTGDRGEQPSAQDPRATRGTVVRITLDGGIPKDNPFVASGERLGEVWTYGHRNPQGAALHPETGELWTIEHGPKGGDELNRIKKGANYGWPIVSYGENYVGTAVGSGEPRAPGIEEPVYYWDPVIAPGGFAFYTGDLFDWNGDILASSLNPGGLVHLRMQGDKVANETRYLEHLGRVRDVEVDSDGSLLLLTDEGNVVRVTPR